MQKDEGIIHKLMALFLLLWGVICWWVLLSVMKAGYVDQYLEDCLTQADLAALVVDPYYYGFTGELVFESAGEVKRIFEEVLEEGLGSNEVRSRLGIKGDVELKDFIVYEVTSSGIKEMILEGDDNWSVVMHNHDKKVKAPNGTKIENSGIYVKIAVPAEFLFGVQVTAIKEHCVDIVSEEIKDE